MNIARLSSKGQIVLPASVRHARAWPTGTRFEMLETAEGVLLKPIPVGSPFAPTRLDEVAGIARIDGPTRSLAEMDAAVLASMAQSL